VTGTSSYRKDWLFWFLVIILATLATYKAITVGFTHDESYSYLHFPNDTFIDIISLKHSFSNNHLLNTLLMKYSEMLFGNEEWALRLPNLLAFFGFASAIWCISRKWPITIAVSFLVLSCCNIALFGFFSMARGYGLSWAFMMWSFYYALNWRQMPTWRNSLGFHVFALLSVMSHFTTASYYASAGVVLFGWSFFSKENSKEHLVRLVAPVLISIVFLYEPLRRVTGHNQFTVGAKDSVLQTIYNQVFHLADPHQLNDTLYTVGVLLLLGIVLLPIVLRSLNIISNRFDDARFSGQIILTIYVVLTILHVAMEADYPTERMALFLLPLFVAHVHFILLGLYQKGKTKFYDSLISIFSVAVVSNFLFYYNPSNLRGWEFEVDIERSLNSLRKEVEVDNSSKQISLGVNWIFEPACNYYRIRNEFEWLKPMTRDRVDPEIHDYAYLYEDTLTQLNAREYEVVERFENSSTVLIRFTNKP
jgi:hypothetical protein